LRHNQELFSGTTSLPELKRDPQQLIEFLFRDQSFPRGVFLTKRTGIVPPDEFTLQHDDSIRITIDGIGVLENHVAQILFYVLIAHDFTRWEILIT
jgi:2-dehydro-3-deoxy-D-arabinonate dehydratase